MSRKVEIRTRMAELQKEFSSLNAEIKTLDEADKRSASKDRFKDYKYKVGTSGYTIETEDKVTDVTDEDREVAIIGMSGLVYTDTSSSSNYGFVLLKERSDYERAKNVLVKLEAVLFLKDEKVKDKEKYIKILLGETDAT
jgi:hypothetical protein